MARAKSERQKADKEPKPSEKASDKGSKADKPAKGSDSKVSPIPDPKEETVTYIPPVVRGGRLLCLIAGAAIVVQHLLTGVILTPFLGGEAFVWGNVLGSLLVSLGVGMLGGELVGRVFGGPPRAGYRMIALAGFLIAAATWVSPRVARFVLDADPDSPWAPAMVLGTLTVLPGILLASVVPGMVESAVTTNIASPARLGRRAVRRFALAMVGGIAGLCAASWTLRHADEAKVWAQLYAVAGSLVLVSLVGVGMIGRGLVLAIAGALAGLYFNLDKSEIQDPKFEKALSEAFVLRGAGRYYAETCPEHVLTGTELERRLNAARKRLQGADKKIAVLLVVETMKTLGPLNLSGTGLKNLLQIYLPEESKPLILPFVDKIASVHSEGDGRKIRIKILRSPEDGHAHFIVPGKNGETQEFEILDDFDLSIVTPTEEMTRFEVGPQVIHPAGFLEFNDTYTTPFKCKNVALWVDACLLGLTIENSEKKVTLSASAQASVGKIQTRVLQEIDKSSIR